MNDTADPFEEWNLEIPPYLESDDLMATITLMASRLPPLTDADVDRVAQRTADLLVDRLERVPESEKKVWREKLRSAAFDLGINL